jgi:hypothetical protein
VSVHPRVAVAVCTVGLSGVFTGCGSSSKTTTKSPAAGPAATARASPALGPEGLYVVTLTAAQLHVTGNPPPGTWSLSLGRQKAEFSDPKGSGTTLTVKALSPTEVTFAPDVSCEARGGRQQDSVFRITQTSAGTRFSVIKASCPSDIAVLTSAEWRKG